MQRLYCAAALFALTALCLFGQDAKKAIKIKPGAAKVGSAAAPAYDKGKLEAYLRHLNFWTADIKVELEDSKPIAKLKGFEEVTVKASLGERSVEQKYLVSSDGETVIKGDVFNVSANPFAKELGLIQNAGHASQGTVGAPVVVSIFTDFQCPYCKDAAKIIRQNLIQNYPKQVRMFLHDFPLEQIHPWARMAAIAGRCVLQQGEDGFWKYHDWIFEKQGSINAENLRSELMTWAPEHGLEALQLGRCFDAKETEGDVNKDLEEARSLGINSTPTLFINGRKLAGSVPWEQLKRVIDFEIAYQATAKNAGDTTCCSVTLNTPGAKQ